MDSVFTYCLYGVVAVLLAVSFFKDKKKTLLSLKRAWKMFVTILPQFVAILLLVGLTLTVLQPETIQHIIGSESGIVGMFVSALIGAITLVPVIVAFPIASELIKSGAGIAQMAVFIATLTTVGIVTLPLEIKYFGRKIAILRNALFFVFAFIAALVMGVLLS